MLDRNVKNFTTASLIPKLHNGIFHVGDEIAVVFGEREEGAVNVDFVEQALDLAPDRVVRHRDPLRVKPAGC